jgi:hypothetical protein
MARKGLRALRLCLVLVLLVGLGLLLAHHHDAQHQDGTCVMCQVSAGLDAPVLVVIAPVVPVVLGAVLAPRLRPAGVQRSTTPCGLRAPPAFL